MPFFQIHKDKLLHDEERSELRNLAMLCRSCGLLLMLIDFSVIFGIDFKLLKKRVVGKVKLYANGNVAFAFLTISGIKTWPKLQRLV